MAVFRADTQNVRKSGKRFTIKVEARTREEARAQIRKLYKNLDGQPNDRGESILSPYRVFEGTVRDVKANGGWYDGCSHRLRPSHPTGTNSHAVARQSFVPDDIVPNNRRTGMSTPPRPTIDLRMVGIRLGDVLALRGDDSKTCVVVNPSADPVPIVAYGGELLSLSAAAAKAMDADDANGPREWMFREQTLFDRRDAFRRWHMR